MQAVTAAHEAEKDRPAGSARQLPARRCVVRRQSGERWAMLRFVVDGEGRLVLDLAERLPGRGVWLTADRGVIEQALKGHMFARALRRRVTVAPDLLAQLEQLLRRRCIEGFGLARRSGMVVAGFEQVTEWLRGGKAGLLVIARDGSEKQVARLDRLTGEVPVCRALDRSALGRAFGRDELTYAAVAPGGLALRLRRDLERLAGLLGDGPVTGPAPAIAETGGAEPALDGVDGRTMAPRGGAVGLGIMDEDEVSVGAGTAPQPAGEHLDEDDDAT